MNFTQDDGWLVQSFPDGDRYHIVGTLWGSPACLLDVTSGIIRIVPGRPTPPDTVVDAMGFLWGTIESMKRVR